MKTFAILLFFAFAFSACFNGKAKQFDKTARKLCNCMNQKLLDKCNDTLGMDIDLTVINYQKCIKNISKNSDPFDPQLSVSIQKICPDLLPVHQIYTRKPQ